MIYPKVGDKKINFYGKIHHVALNGCFKHLSYNTANVVIHRGLIRIYETYSHKY